MKRLILFLFLFSCLCLHAQDPVCIPVWPNGAPESNRIAEAEKIGSNGILYNCSKAELFAYFPEKDRNTGAAVVICPGGGYAVEAIGYEGHDFAKLLSKNGITGIVLKYRLPNGHKNIPLSDAKQAMTIVRNNASEWGIDPHKIGISGFSAGGHLASTLGTHFDAENRPDFMILFYPVITLDKPYTHQGSRECLLGTEKDDVNIVNRFSNEKQVTSHTPPTLLFLSDDDTGVPPYNSIEFYKQLKENKIPASMYIFPTGGHGWGCHTHFEYYNVWTSLLFDWLNKQSITGK